MPLPTNVRLVLDGAGQQDSDLVARSDMDRGPAKTRRMSTDPVVTMTATLLFLSAAAIQGFRVWFYSAAGGNAGQAWFDWTDPRTGQIRQVRLVSSSMGALKPVAGGFVVATQPCALEYVERFDL
jgi:hypothetical protein